MLYIKRICAAKFRRVKMDKLFFCLDCKRIIECEEKCNYCNGENIEELEVGSPVSIIESKVKGKVLKIKNDTVRVLVAPTTKDKYIKDYSADKLRKVL